MKLRSIGAAASGTAAVLAASAALTACSGATRTVALDADPVAAVQQASGTTSRTGTSKIDTLVTMTVAGRTTTMQGTGAFDYGRQVGEIRITVPRGTSVSEMDEILTPDALYMRNVAATGQSSAKWVKVDVSKLADGDLISSGSTSPSIAFEMLRGASADVHVVGKDTVAGTQVTHYQGTLDLAKAANAASPMAKTSLQAAVRAFAQAAVPFDAYLDDQGKLRRFVGTFSFWLPGQQRQLVKVVSATDLYDFGTSVDAAAPAAADVVTQAKQAPSGTGAVPGPGSDSGSGSASKSSAPSTGSTGTTHSSKHH